MKYKIILLITLLTLSFVIAVNIFGESKVEISDSDIGDLEKIREIISEEKSKEVDMIGSLDENLEQIMSFNTKEGIKKIAIPYKIGESESPLRLMIFDREGDNWIEEDEISLVGESFDKVLFEDITGDNCPEILTGVKMGDSQIKGLVIYGYRDGELVEFLSDSYDSLIVENIKSDRVKEILIAKRSSDDDVINLAYYRQLGGKIRMLDTIEIENSGDYIELSLIEVSSDERAILVQGEVEGDRGYIEILKLSEEKLQSIDILGEEKIVNPFHIRVQDINGDSKPEIPYIKETQGIENGDGKAWVAEWYQLDEKYNLDMIKKEYIDRKNEFALEYREDSNNTGLLVKKVDNGEYEERVEFRNYQSGEIVFSIEVYNSEDWSKKTKEYRRNSIIVSKSADRAYILIIPEGSDLKSDQEKLEQYIDEIKSRFRNLDFTILDI